MRGMPRAGLSASGNTIRQEVLVRIRLLLMATALLAACGAPTRGIASSPAAAASGSPAATAGTCGTAAAPPRYQHVIWIWMENHSYGDIIGNKSQAPYYASLSGCASRDVPYTQLAADLAHNALPAFSFITPNLTDDMHDGTIAQGDAWLASHLPAVLNSSQYRAGTTAVFIAWDEGAGGYPAEDCDGITVIDASCRVPTIVISPSTPPGTTSGTFFSHYSLLATTEELLGLPRIGQASSAATMTAAFHL
jgi:phosphoesterase family protein